MSMSFITEHFKIAKGPNTSLALVHCEVKFCNILLLGKALKHDAVIAVFHIAKTDFL